MLHEYGIACLLKTESIDKLREAISIDDANIPHLSLFQFAIDDDSLLTKLNSYISDINIPHEYAALDIVEGGGNIYLNIADNNILHEVSDNLCDFYSQHARNVYPLSQINIRELNKRMKELVNQYGLWWIKEFYQPHVTLHYNQGHYEPTIYFSAVIRLDRPYIYRIDHLGRILENKRIGVN